MMSSKIIAGLIVLGVVTFLLLSSPAGAFILGLKVSDNIVEKGQIVKLSASVDMQDGEVANDISYLLLKLKGPTSAVCKFLRNGTPVSGCTGIVIEVVDSGNNEYGYCGYGYGGCPLKYNIQINSSYFEIGNYQTFLDITTVKGKTSEKPGENFSIVIPNKTCSVRASDGSLTVSGEGFTSNKLSFFVPLRKAKNGEGTLSAGSGKDRLVYDFKIEKVLLNNLTEMDLQVSGKYKIGMGQYVNETSTIKIDKVNNKISLVDGIIAANNMTVTFKQSC